jgi:hypothetical protein
MAMQFNNPRCGESREACLRGLGIEQFDHPITVKEYLSEAEWHRLAWHMHNENGPHDFSMYFIGDDLVPRVAASRRRTISDAISSSWRSMTEKVDRPFAAVLYPTSQAQTSTWACIDVDHHHGSVSGKAHAEWVIKILSNTLLRPEAFGLQDLAWILESSGRGYHLFLLNPESRPVREWRQLMSAILAAAGLSEADGIELYPLASGKRKGVRLPGSANPKTWNLAAGSYDVSRFLAVAGLKDLIAALPQSFNKRGSPFLLKRDGGGEGPVGGRSDDRPAPWSEHVDADRLLGRYAITAPSTRHNRLASLVGDGFWHFSRAVLREIAVEQHARANPPCGSGLDDHRRDFDCLYDGRMEQFRRELTSLERETCAKLRTPDALAAFVIVRNFARFARTSGKYGPDRGFPFSGQDLACRLQMSVRNAYNLRKRLIGYGFLEKVSECVPRQKAEYYRWLLLPMDDP